MTDFLIFALYLKSILISMYFQVLIGTYYITISLIACNIWRNRYDLRVFTHREKFRNLAHFCMKAMQF